VLKNSRQHFSEASKASRWDVHLTQEPLTTLAYVGRAQEHLGRRASGRPQELPFPVLELHVPDGRQYARNLAFRRHQRHPGKRVIQKSALH
jgi:hypothetical protein